MILHQVVAYHDMVTAGRAKDQMLKPRRCCVLWMAFIGTGVRDNGENVCVWKAQPRR
jgi:hypothetical protein